MNDLIKVTYNSDRPTTSARDLWEFLDKPYSQFTKWFDQYKDYGFTENQDFRAISEKFLTAQGNESTRTDYEITVDMAKELAMLQKSEKGKMARQYFINLEKQWNSPEAIMARALKMADRKMLELQSKIEQDRPKTIFADAVAASQTSILVGDLAKLIKQNGYDIGQKRLFEYLRENAYLIKFGSSWNMPTQRSMDMGLFEVKETTINNPDGSIRITKTPKVTGKGQIYFINHFLTGKHIGPLSLAQ
jgi:anti-repressor protein